MQIIPVDPRAPDPAALAIAAEILRAGGLVAFPTETVYGLGANALDEDAVRRIFAAKGRPSFNPLIAHVPSVEAARALAAAWPEAAERAARAFWPGPLTLVLPKRAHIPDAVTAGLASVALRVPAHPVAHALLQAVGLPLAAPSANRYTELSPTTAEHVAKGLGDQIDLILDGGPTPVGIESTVLDVSGPVPILLRHGTIPLPELEALLGEVLPPPTLHGAEARPAPGMVARHYSPRARLLVFPWSERERMAETVRAAARRGETTGGILRAPLIAPVDHPILMSHLPEVYARELYAALHDLDDEGCDLIVCDSVPDEPAWAGVRDRLARAARDD